jgi:hypothetical protein
VAEFTVAVERDGGKVEVVWEHNAGVGRRIMRVAWGKDSPRANDSA